MPHLQVLPGEVLKPHEGGAWAVRRGGLAIPWDQQMYLLNSSLQFGDTVLMKTPEPTKDAKLAWSWHDWSGIQRRSCRRYSACSLRRLTAQPAPAASCRHRGGFTFSMGVFGASWENTVIHSCFFLASVLLSTRELLIATRYKKRKHNLIYRESQFWSVSEPYSENLV